MTQYTARFRGRTKGAIGILHDCTVKVEADSLEQAHLKLYETHEHIGIVNWGGLTDDEVLTILGEKGCDREAWKRLAEAVGAFSGRMDLSESQKHAAARCEWVRNNCLTCDGDLIQNNIGKGCAVLGLKTPLFF